MTFTSSGTENLMRWDRRARPFMEVWYATLTHRELRSGLWLRYTISAPRNGDPACALWAFYFDPDGTRSFAGRNYYSTDSLGFAPGRDDGAIVRIGDAWLSETHLDGSVRNGERSLSWSLDIEPADRCYQHLPPRVRGFAAKRVSTLCSPNLAVPFTGTIELDGETVTYEGDRGQQSHRWGRRHSRSWAWAHCSEWDDGGDTVFEAVSANASPMLPPLTFMYLRYRGEDILFDDLRSARRAVTRLDFPIWAFATSNDRWKVSGAARMNVDRAFQVHYDDPDGGARHCFNSEIADLAFEIYEAAEGAWRHVGSVTSNGMAHVELGRPDPFEELLVAF